MIKLSNKPNGCSNCPFCYKEERYRYTQTGIEAYERRYCGAIRGEPDQNNCPLR